MALKNKYQREKQQYTYDSGRTWIDVSPANYRRGRLIEAGSEDCNTVEWKEVTGSWFCIGFNDIQYRWVTVSDEYVCVGYNKYSIKKKQQSVDGGTTWTDVSPIETRQGDLIQANSADCGYVPPTPGYYENQYLTIESLEDSNIIKFGSSNGLQKTIQVSTDGGTTWISKTSPNQYSKITLATLNTGDKLLIKGTNTAYSDGIQSNSITGGKQFILYGNIMSLISGDNFVDNKTLTAKNTFKELFKYNDKTLISAENLVLPATTLASACYSQMFYGCTSLTTAPSVLPAITLAEGCYDLMFTDCTSLTSAPELPATTLAEWCYWGMFQRCTNLVNIPSILPATTLVKSCYDCMFKDCKNITTAPELPAETAVENCYNQMFYSCSKLNYIKCLAKNVPAEGEWISTDYTGSWVNGVAKIGIFIKDSQTDWTTGESGIPEGWTIQNA